VVTVDNLPLQVTPPRSAQEEEEEFIAPLISASVRWPDSNAQAAASGVL